VLQRVIETAFRASNYMNNRSSKKIEVNVAILIPFGDPIAERLDKNLSVVEGPELDVLVRYQMLFDKSDYPDYVCRITADCPMLPSFIISKMITLAIMNGYDYVSNVDERFRTTPDGWDCEVISRRAFDYLAESTLTDSDKEHVTTFLRGETPKWLKRGTVVNHLDLSEIKNSVDSKEDLDRVIRMVTRLDEIYETAVSIYGRDHIHRI
jgi:spore coat polysaccharide biosynthesis protein SpsF (cytidylyltransferase family)